MQDSPTRFALSIPNGQFEVTGSEEFVDKQVERFESLIRTLLDRSQGEGSADGSRGNGAIDGNPVPPNGRGGDAASALTSLENVFALADDKIQILKDLPGSGKAQKTVNAALLTTYANTLRGADEVSFDTIREMCEAHGCLDSGNFAKTISSEKELFIVGGSERKKTARLTVPGRRKAEQLARDLNTP